MGGAGQPGLRLGAPQQRIRDGRGPLRMSLPPNLSPCSKPCGNSSESSRQSPTSAGRSLPPHASRGWFPLSSLQTGPPPHPPSVFPLPSLSLGGSSQQRLFSSLCSLKEQLPLQVPAMRTGPQFPHLQTEGASSGLQLFGQATFPLQDSISSTVPSSIPNSASFSRGSHR